ncbi:GtrA family protein [Catelliglobosispora koreensis]|uniref:GtrA family protein n=1 Tax=Catelliglobosispora koreensis TaxID=129052 RepID=UPI00037B8352|nr:GtrA family protein [Catelliglobosispora koreensis]
MRLAQFVPPRLRALGPEVAKFGVIGGINVIVNAVAFNLLLLLPVFDNSQVKAKVLATAVAIVSAYFMNRHWTYKDRDKSAAHREFVLFLFFNLVGLLIEVAVMSATKYMFGLTSWLAINVAMLVGLAIGTVFRFFTYRTWVFKHADPELEPAFEAEFEQLTAPLEVEFALKQRKQKRRTRKSPAPARTR